MLKRFNSKISKLIFLLLSIIVVFSFTENTYAASLSLSPSPSNVSVGNIISLKIYVNTNGKSINNTEATIQFPTDLLEVISVTKSSSIFSLWVEEPSFSNKTGKITFNGGVPTPGYTGQSGYIATITFKAKKQGNASVIFSDGAVRENDGLGTDILTTKSSGSIQINAQQTVEVPEIKVDKGDVIAKPIIISDTHPNQESWYSSNTANFRWNIPSGVTSLKTLFNKIPDSNPIISYDNSVTQRTLNDISEGTSYFHLRYFNSSGGSSISHYKVKIDFTSPKSFSPTIRIDGTKNLIKLDAEDAISGVDHYIIQIDGGASLEIKKTDLLNNEYILPVQNEGAHDMIVTAYDKAGNKKEAKLRFNSSQISVPILSLNSKEITSGDSVVIYGKTDYPNQQVNIVLEIDGKEIKRYVQKTEDDGNFSINTNEIKTVGIISIWAETIFQDNIKSNSSEKIYLRVNETAAVKVTLAIVYPLVGLIIVLILLFIIIILLYLGWRKYFGLKKKIENESKEITTEVHKAMVLLKEELENQLEALEKIKIDRDLNKKEEVIFDEIKDNINEIDNFIEKKLKKLN